MNHARRLSRFAPSSVAGLCQVIELAGDSIQSVPAVLQRHAVVGAAAPRAYHHARHDQKSPLRPKAKAIPHAGHHARRKSDQS